MKRAEKIKAIELALDEIRPFLMEDGGDVQFRELSDDGVVKVELLGACKNCSMNTMTFKNGVEESIKRAVPGLKEVQAIL